MKVKCIKNYGWCDLLTIGKTYEVIKEDKYGNYIIITDNGYGRWYEKEYFKPLSEIRNDKIDKLLNDDVTNES